MGNQKLMMLIEAFAKAFVGGGAGALGLWAIKKMTNQPLDSMINVEINQYGLNKEDAKKK